MIAAWPDAGGQAWSWQDPVAWLLGVVVIALAWWLHKRSGGGGCDGCQ